jgi:hypothetical protein
MLCPMGAILKLIWQAVVGLLRSRASLEAEILMLRHQLNVLRRKSPKRLAFSNLDRLVFAGLYRLVPAVVNALVIVEPETVIGWHRAGFRSFWRWKSRCRDGRPKVPLEIRATDPRHEPRQPTLGRSPDSWRTPQARHRSWPNLSRQVHGQAQETAIPRLEDIPSQPRRWIAAMDLFVVPTISFRLLYGLLILRHGRRQMLWLGVTAQPTAEWIARQLTEAYGWQQSPAFIVRDRDRVYPMPFSAGFEPWGFVTGQPRRDRHGRMAILNG